MGCDIHLHLEYYETPPGRLRRKQARTAPPPPYPNPLGARPVIANRFYIPRDYALFAALAGVRNSENRPVKFPPRGLPKDVSREIFHQYYVEIFPADTSADWLQAGWKWCRPDDAQKLAEKPGKQIEERGSRRFIAGEDLHSPSHLCLGEIHESLRHAAYDEAQLSPQFVLVLGAMEFIDKQYGDHCSRIVFWFDC